MFFFERYMPLTEEKYSNKTIRQGFGEERILVSPSAVSMIRHSTAVIRRTHEV